MHLRRTERAWWGPIPAVAALSLVLLAASAAPVHAGEGATGTPTRGATCVVGFHPGVTEERAREATEAACGRLRRRGVQAAIGLAGETSEAYRLELRPRAEGGFSIRLTFERDGEEIAVARLTFDDLAEAEAIAVRVVDALAPGRAPPAATSGAPPTAPVAASSSEITSAPTPAAASLPRSPPPSASPVPEPRGRTARSRASSAVSHVHTGTFFGGGPIYGGIPGLGGGAGAGLSFGIFYEGKRHAIGPEYRWLAPRSGSETSTMHALGCTARAFFGEGATAIFMGGSLDILWLSNRDSAGSWLATDGNGIGLSLLIGAEVLRTDPVRLQLEARVGIPLFSTRASSSAGGSLGTYGLPLTVGASFYF